MGDTYQHIMERLMDPHRRDSSVPLSWLATEEDLDEVERQLGHALPSDYRDFLRFHGGRGVLAQFDVWEDGVLRSEGIANFDSFRVLVEGHQWLIEDYDNEDPAKSHPGLSLVRSMEGIEKVPWPPELLMIATSGGLTHVCLALAGLRPGAVFCWKDCPDDDEQGVYLVADSFDEFMHLLYPC